MATLTPAADGWAVGGTPIRRTPELERVLAIPRRNYADSEGEHLAREMTAAIKLDWGQQSLRPVQAIALYDIGMGVETGTAQGLFCTARVGAGKTLISLLAPYVVEAQRPIVFVPAKLIHKTVRDAEALRKHWPIPGNICIESYEKLGTLKSAMLLDAYRPDLIICDEVHKLKNPKAARTRRMKRYMEQNPGTRFIGLSGTITKRSLMDYAHILEWTHGMGRPLPNSQAELEEWCLALDEKVPVFARKKAGAMALFCNTEELGLLNTADEMRAVRQGYQRRLVETAGVIHTKEAFVGASIQIASLDITPDIQILSCFQMLRHDWCRPDGADLANPVEIYRHARQLSLGFYYRWNPTPPPEWIEARRVWNKFVRTTLSNNQLNLDSELPVTNAVDRGVIDGQDFLAAWREIRPTFEPRTECVWITDAVVKQIGKWVQSNKGIVWVEHVELGRKIEDTLDIPYYGRSGKDRKGNFIDDHPPGTPFAASIHSNNEGRNLQAWSKNLITSVMPNGLQWEQLVGRTHRDGQEADEVTFDVMIGCCEHVKAWDQSIRDAEYSQASLGQVQKILYADVDMPLMRDLEHVMEDGVCAVCRMHSNDFGGKQLKWFG